MANFDVVRGGGFAMELIVSVVVVVVVGRRRFFARYDAVSVVCHCCYNNRPEIDNL